MTLSHRCLGGLLGAALVVGGLGVLPATTATAATATGTEPTISIDPAYDGPSTRARTADAAPSVAAYPLPTTFALHSKPGSQRTIYLDFDGTDLTGSRWTSAVDSHAKVNAVQQPGWSLDADPAFGDLERNRIQDVWQAVAEDFAPFDVDVTTQAPAAGILERASTGDAVYGVRALITGGASPSAPKSTADDDLCSSSCSGIAYNDTFDAVDAAGTGPYQPALVFGDQLSDDAHAIADTISHEVGHTLGLAHDGTSSQAYYPGQGAWGPIMGSPSNVPVTQWSKGEYAGANQPEDDLAIIAAAGTPLRTDDFPGTVAAAGALPAATGTPAATGLITTRNDVDVFALGTCAGSVSVTASPAAAFSPDLDLSVTLLNAVGGAVAGPVDTPTTRTSRTVAAGLGATATVDAGAGTPLWVAVDGVGSGSAAGPGYSDYGSLGRYLVSATGCTTAGAPAPSPVVVRTPGAPSGLSVQSVLGSVAVVTWQAPVDDGGAPIEAYLMTLDGTDQVVAPTATSATVSGLLAGRPVSLSLRARNSAGYGPAASVGITAPVVASSPAPAAGAPAALVTTVRPTLGGKSRVGKRLVVTSGGYSRAVSVTYQWRVGSTPVGTGSSYAPRAKQVGKKVTVTVTAVSGTERVVTTLTSKKVAR